VIMRIINNHTRMVVVLLLGLASLQEYVQAVEA